MTRRVGIKNTLIFIQIFIITIQLNIKNTYALPSPEPSPSSWGDTCASKSSNKESCCDNACESYKKAELSLKVAVKDACGPSPTPAPQASGTPTGGDVSKWETCSINIGKMLGTTSGQLGDYCKSRDLIEKARQFEMGAMVAYGVAFGTCLANCIVMTTTLGGGGLATLAEAGCTAADIAATGLDIASTTKLTKAGNKSAQDIANDTISDFNFEGGNIGTLAVGGAGAVGAGVTTAATLHAYRKKPGGTAPGVAGAADDVVEKATKEVGEAVAEKAEKSGVKNMKPGWKVLSCGTAALFAAILTVKGVQYFDKMPKMKTQLCTENILPLPAVQAYDPTPTGSDGPLKNDKPSLGTSGGNQPGQSGNLESQGATGNSDAGNNGQAPSYEPSQLAALAAQDPISKPFEGPLNTMLSANPDINKALAKALAGGASSTDAMAAAFPEIAPVAGEMLKNLKELNDQGQLQVDGLGGAVPTGGGKRQEGGGSERKDFMSLFGSRVGMAQQAVTEATFKPSSQKKSALSNNGDIWHSDWKGSLFQIHSLKIDQERNRISNLEWSTPLNRALLGLPKISTSSGASPSRGESKK